MSPLQENIREEEMIVTLPPNSIVYEKSIQHLCVRPYPNHKKGCPNYNKKRICPPNQLLINEIIDLNKNAYVIYTDFNLGNHVIKMKERHPIWSERQLYCCLYWQKRARKTHFEELFKSRVRGRLLNIIHCPEAHGVNVTALMKVVGIELEWPPRNITRIVSLGQ